MASSLESPTPLRGKLSRVKCLLDDANNQLLDEAMKYEIFTTKTSATVANSNNNNKQPTYYKQNNEKPLDPLIKTMSDINTLKTILSCPIFNRIVNVTDSLDKISYHLNMHPSMGPSDININTDGELLLSTPIIEETSLNNFINSRLDQYSDHSNGSQEIMSPNRLLMQQNNILNNHQQQMLPQTQQQQQQQQQIQPSPVHIEQNNLKTSSGSTEPMADECDSGASSYQSQTQAPVVPTNIIKSYTNYGYKTTEPISSEEARHKVSISSTSPLTEDAIDSSIEPVPDTTVADDNNTTEIISVNLIRDKDVGLGITIAGYRHKGEEISGMFVRSIEPDSPVARSGQIRLYDQVYAVNGKSVLELTNPEVLELLKNSGREVRLELARIRDDSRLGLLRAKLEDLKPPTSIKPGNLTQLVHKNIIPTTINNSNFQNNVSPPIAAQRTNKVIETKQGARNTVEIKSPLCQTTTATYVSEFGKGEFFTSTPPMGANSYSVSKKTLTERLLSEGFPGDNPSNSTESDKSVRLQDLEWEKESQIVEIVKDQTAHCLGFSVKQYQDPRNPEQKIIMITGITPGGIAAQDGRLGIGDLLIFVDDTNLEGSKVRLDDAANALKKANGPVRLGVLKLIRNEN